MTVICWPWKNWTGIENVTWNLVRAEQSRRMVFIFRESTVVERDIGCFEFIRASSVRRRDVKWWIRVIVLRI